MNHLINLAVNEEERTITKNLLKAYPFMKAAVDIFTLNHKAGSDQYNEFDLANTEGRGTRGDINGRGRYGDIVGNTVLLREERPVMILDYERKCKAIDMAIQALPEEKRTILKKCFVEQKKDKYIYEIILNIPKSTYDYYKKNAVESVTCILKAANII
ncbi:hypothetical protein EDM56_12030 [Brevibacillus fluminis]|uniref:Uncharacterized protein n=1 Tax=Brevibacillus fluminis TaxID=511487 RepID=A0A3M8DP28_9BACL|nr:hypothetical protein [Brevibacillus fluminis]RNB89880.1 hypothetical protein EDM56_12030 [Brevibacillus fluminis]